MCMKRNETGEGFAKADFIRTARSLYPVAHGTLSLVNKRCNSPYCKACKDGIGHPSYIFTYSLEGKKRCLHIQPRHADAVRKAIENGKALERAILDEGLAFIERLREQG